MIRPSRPFFSAAAALILAVGCSEANAPAEPRATVDVVVYLDRDGSGSVTAGDEMLEGVSATVFQGEAQVGTATTNTSGHAFVSNVAPGSYRVEIDGAPVGAALVTNSRPTAVVNAKGDTADVEFRFVYFPGSVSGVVYRDDDGDGVLDASDTRGAGLWVFLRASTSGAAGAKLDSVQTDNSGAYLFPRVAPGDYFLDFEQPTTISYTTTGPQAITVAPQSAVSLNRVFTGSLILTIAEARAKTLGSAIAVEGVVTAPPNIFTSGTGGVNSEIWIQDATGGIAVFSVLSSTSATYPLGQRVQVSGTLGTFSGQLQVSTPTVTLVSGGTPVSPTSISGAVLTSRVNEGKLVTISSVTITSVPTGTGAAFNVTGTHSDGTPVTIRVGGANTGLTRSSFTVGQVYTITGIQTVFVSGTTVTPQIKPRFGTDVTLQVTSTPGMVIISELMADPNAVSDNNGEYFELYNAGGTAVDLNGWTFVDGTTTPAPHTITGITIGPGEYRVFGLDANTATNGGMTVDQQYSAIFLNNGVDRLVLKNASGVTMDSVAYTTRTVGAAFGIIDPTIDAPNMNGANWQIQTSIYGAGDRGTPRSRNDNQVGPVPAAAAAAAAVVRLTAATKISRGRNQ